MQLTEGAGYLGIGAIASLRVQEIGFTGGFTIRDAPDSGFYYLAGYRINRIVKNYPAGLFGRIVFMPSLTCQVSTYL